MPIDSTTSNWFSGFFSLANTNPRSPRSPRSCFLQCFDSCFCLSLCFDLSLCYDLLTFLVFCHLVFLWLFCWLRFPFVLDGVSVPLPSWPFPFFPCCSFSWHFDPFFWLVCDLLRLSQKNISLIFFFAVSLLQKHGTISSNLLDPLDNVQSPF